MTMDETVYALVLVAVLLACLLGYMLLFAGMTGVAAGVTVALMGLARIMVTAEEVR